jgi:putative ABC transport system permease protein
VWEFDLVGIYDVANDSVETEQMFMNFEFFDEYRQWSQGTVGNIVVKINDPDNSAAIASEIDRLFANSSDETKTTTEKAYNQMFAKQVGDIGLIMTGILSAVFFTILLLTGNTMAQAIRERIPELAILKTIGFSNISLLMIVLCEALLIVLVGSLPGLMLAAVLLARFSQSVAIFNGVELSGLIVAQGVGLAFLMALLVGLPPALRAMRLNIVDALGDH